MTVRLLFKRIEKSLRNVSVYRRIMISFVLLSFVPMCVIGLVTYMSYLHIIEEKVSDYCIQINNDLRNNVDIILKEIDTITSDIIYSKEIQESVWKLYKNNKYSSIGLERLSEFRALFKELELVSDEPELSKYINNTISDTDKILEYIDDHPELMQKIKDSLGYDGKDYFINRSIEDFIQKQSVLSDIGIIDAEIQFTKEGNNTITLGIRSDIDIFKDTPRSESLKPYSGEVNYSTFYLESSTNSHSKRTSSSNALCVTRELVMVKKNVESIGTFKALIDINVFDSVYNEIITDGDLYILNPYGEVVYSNVSSNIQRDMEYILPPEESFSGNRITKLHVDIDGEEMLNTYSKSSINDWIVVYSVPYNKLVKAAADVSNVIAFLSVVLLVLSIVGSVIISRSIVNPLNNIGNMIKQVEKGNYETRITPYGKDELTSVSKTLNNMSLEINRLVNEVYRASIKKREAEFHALQAQINPHFLFNTLDSIRWEARNNMDFDVSERIEILSKMFRRVIGELDDITTIEKEIEHTKNYLYFQKLRFQDRIRINWEIDPGVGRYKVIKLLLQPLVENSIVHGMEPNSGTLELGIFIRKSDQYIFIKIVDDGLGADKQTILAALDGEKVESDKKSIGLKNVKDRLELTYGKLCRFDIESIPGKGTYIEISIPIYEGGGTQCLPEYFL